MTNDINNDNCQFEINIWKIDYKKCQRCQTSNGDRRQR